MMACVDIRPARLDGHLAGGRDDEHSKRVKGPLLSGKEASQCGCQRMKSSSLRPSRPCATVIMTPTHRTFFLCFASGAGPETKLIRGMR